jgi:hypothetical protein
MDPGWDCYYTRQNSSVLAAGLYTDGFVTSTSSCERLVDEFKYISCFRMRRPSLTVYLEAAGLALATVQLCAPLLVSLVTLPTSEKVRIEHRWLAKSGLSGIGALLLTSRYYAPSHRQLLGIANMADEAVLHLISLFLLVDTPPVT